jgi:hypothetical protein
MRVFPRWLIAALLLAPACAYEEDDEGPLTHEDLDPGDVDGHWLLDNGIERRVLLETTDPSRLGGGPEELQPAGSCWGYNNHYHYIDWGYTRLTHRWSSECPASGPLLRQYDGFCMYNSGVGYSCGGDWFVQGALTWEPPEYYRFAKIRALNGH